MLKDRLIVLLLSLTGIITFASAATAFSAITSVGPITKTIWRLQITTFCFIILATSSISANFPIYKSLLQSSWKRMIVSGSSIGLHFSLWTISMQYTSIAHSLVFLYSCPILLVVYYMIRCQKPRAFQIIGTLVGFAGMFIMVFFGAGSNGTTWYGDLIALAGALALCVNLIASESLVLEKPFFYLFSIHFVATLFCMIIGTIYDPPSFFDYFGYLYTIEGLYALYLGVVCGFIGNGSFYLLLKYVSPLFLSVIINFDPIVGSLFAWAFGYQPTPGLFTLVGGSIAVLGNLTATISSQLKPSSKPLDDTTQDSSTSPPKP